MIYLTFFLVFEVEQRSQSIYLRFVYEFSKQMIMDSNLLLCMPKM